MGSNSVMEAAKSGTLDVILCLSEARMAVNAAMDSLTDDKGRAVKRVALVQRKKAQREAHVALTQLAEFLTRNADMIGRAAMEHVPPRKSRKS